MEADLAVPVGVEAQSLPMEFHIQGVLENVNCETPYNARMLQ